MQALVSFWLICCICCCYRSTASMLQPDLEEDGSGDVLVSLDLILPSSGSLTVTSPTIVTSLTIVTQATVHDDDDDATDLLMPYSTDIEIFTASLTSTYGTVKESLTTPTLPTPSPYSASSEIITTSFPLLITPSSPLLTTPSVLQTTLSPSLLTTTSPSMLTIPSTLQITPFPSLQTTPSTTLLTTPSTTLLTTPSISVFVTTSFPLLTESPTTPSPSPSLLTTPSPSLVTTPSPSLLTTPSPSFLTTPSSSLLTTPSSSLLTTSSLSLLTTSFPLLLSTLPSSLLTTPSPSLLITFPSSLLTTPSPSLLTTPSPSLLTTSFSSLLITLPSLTTSLLTTPPPSMPTTPSQVTSSQASHIITIASSPVSSMKAFSSSKEAFQITTDSFGISTTGSPIIVTTRTRLSATSSMSTTPSPMFSRVPVVMVTVLNATAIRVSWTPVEDSSGYRIYILAARNNRKRQTNEQIIVEVSGGHVTSHVIANLEPFTTYSVSMASLDIDGNEGPRSSQTPPLTTDEAAPSSPRNATWNDLSNGSIAITWLPPEFPNGIISNYTVVLLFVNGSQTQYIVPGNQTMLIIPRPGVEFSVSVSAANNAGNSSPQDRTDPTVTSEEDDKVLSPGVIAAIAAFCVLLVLLIVAAIATILILWSRRWYKYHGNADINVNELEYQACDVAEFEKKKEEEEDIDGQLTAKRWMRANANYSVPSLLLPPISELVSTYKTAEDLVESKTIVRQQPSAAPLQTVGESSATAKEIQSTNSSSERSCEAASTLSSVCSKSAQEANKVVHHLPPPPAGGVRGEEEASCAGRDSKLLNDDQALFEMMENVYIVSPQEMDSMKMFEVQGSTDFDMKEQIGLGQSSKIMRAIVNSPSSLTTLREGSEVAVKILNDDANVRNQENFLGAAYIMSQFSHKNVLSLLGVLTNSQPLMTVFTYASIGDLKHFLTRVRRKTRLESQQCNFGLLQQLMISFQIAAGMEYLASKFFIHRALQAKCILLSEDYSIKIGGFRISHSLAQPAGYFELKSSGLLPVKWLAMETLIDGKFSSNTDIWTFGVVLWEVFAFGLTPFRGIQNEDVLQQLKEGKRLNKPSGCPDDIYALMLHCWNERARERPVFTTLHAHLLSYHANLAKEQSDIRIEPPTDSSLVNGAEQQLNSNIDVTTTSETSVVTLEGEDPLLSADNSRVALLPDSPSQERKRTLSKVNNCDLVLTTSNSKSLEEAHGMELSNNMFNNIEHSLSLGASSSSYLQNGQDNEQLYTKL